LKICSPQNPESQVITADDIRENLQDIGYTVLAVVSSGEEAIKKIEEASPDSWVFG
jgi:CheY-like chemotaxis protein